MSIIDGGKGPRVCLKQQPLKIGRLMHHVHGDPTFPAVVYWFPTLASRGETVVDCVPMDKLRAVDANSVLDE